MNEHRYDDNWSSSSPSSSSSSSSIASHLIAALWHFHCQRIVEKGEITKSDAFQLFLDLSSICLTIGRSRTHRSIHWYTCCHVTLIGNCPILIMARSVVSVYIITTPSATTAAANVQPSKEASHAMPCHPVTIIVWGWFRGARETCPLYSLIIGRFHINKDVPQRFAVVALYCLYLTWQFAHNILHCLG